MGTRTRGTPVSLALGRVRFHAESVTFGVVSKNPPIPFRPPHVVEAGTAMELKARLRTTEAVEKNMSDVTLL
jgi:hypothetical protein